ncbi:MAG: PSD1 and planctomycete cytochrome C domain-containing protein [Planctomycetota bacterium]|nr:PSD1 and planctomycete cytochrome C domain-containing protein [Planctomycetota bacterium]
MPRRLCALAFLLLVPLASDLRGAPPVDFQRDVQPILNEHCNACHGVDANDRKSGLRLDLRENALKGGESGTPAIVPGKTDDGELLRRILSADESEVMPPRSHNKPLTPKQIETLKRWIADGAKYETHWAFSTPQKPAVPAVVTPHPIDAFVRSHLKSLEIAPSRQADPATLCRRLYLDLIGLPPTPEELATFEKVGVEATVKTLLASERFGEKWARHWLDVARYSDTNGYEKDVQREQWAWRDWVIDAFNRDMPYDQFLIEQIAGDLLPQATQSQVIATGFLRNSMINEEGAIVAEQFRMVEMFDRIDCVGKAVLGLSTQCAQCHTHKFDPLTHDEYYGMFAYLNNTYEAQSWVYTADQQKQLADIRLKVEDAERRWRATRPQWEREFADWQQNLLSQQIVWEPLETIELGSISGLNHPTQEADKSILMKGHPSGDVFFIGVPKLDGVTGVRLEALTHRDLPHNGPGRSRLGTWAIHEVEAFVKKPGSNDWEKLKLVNATADFSEPEQKQPDGKKPRGPVGLLIDGTDDSTWLSDRGMGLRNQPSTAVLQFEQPVNAPEGTQFKFVMRMGDMLGCCRVSLTRQAAPVAPPVDHAAILALQTPADRRPPQQTATLLAAWRANDEIATLWKSSPQAGTSILHLADRDPADPRATHLLDRGNWDRPLQVVEPHVPAAFHPFPADAPQNRLGFARWLADAKSPLTARVEVNRVWQSIFGVGLVETAEDFGTRAAVPEYREVLDWLAVDFMEHGWSRKHLIATIVTSATYQQSSSATATQLERDPRNALLARGPRFRADAEVVRDIALAVSGLLTAKMGGPGVIPPVPQNMLDYNYVYPGYWKPAEGAERYRRTVYGFRKRSMPDPVMSNFDAPNGDFACARRIRSNTPLAALTGLNETIFVESARALALRVLKEGGATDADRASRAFSLCTLRQPTPAERDAILTLLESRRKRIADGWLNPREVTTGDPATLPALPPNTTPQDAAAWTLVARVLLNLDETMTKN